MISYINIYLGCSVIYCSKCEIESDEQGNCTDMLRDVVHLYTTVVHSIPDGDECIDLFCLLHDPNKCIIYNSGYVKKNLVMIFYFLLKDKTKENISDLNDIQKTVMGLFSKYCDYSCFAILQLRVKDTNPLFDPFFLHFKDRKYIDEHLLKGTEEDFPFPVGHLFLEGYKILYKEISNTYKPYII